MPDSKTETETKQIDQCGVLPILVNEKGCHRIGDRADSKYQQASGCGCRRAIASNAVMSCITACRPARIYLNPARRNRFKAAVRSVAITPAPLPR